MEARSYVTIPVRVTGWNFTGGRPPGSVVRKRCPFGLQTARFFLSAVKGTTSGFTSALKSLYLSLTVCW